MRNIYTVNTCSTQSSEPSVTIQIWDYTARVLRPCLIDLSDLQTVNSAVNGHWYAIKARGAAQKWYANGKVWDGSRTRTIIMHRVIVGETNPDIEVDHKDNDGLNNQRYNLRCCTHLQNMRYRQPDRDWEAYDRARELAAEYRLERQASAITAQRFGIARSGMYSIRDGRTTTSYAAMTYVIECERVGCRTLAQLKADHPVENAQWGAVLVTPREAVINSQP